MKPSQSCQPYSLGLLFTRYNTGQFQTVVLLRKKKPADQAGKLNGVGGKFEPGENWLSCIIRETEEEAGIPTTATDWTLVGTLYKPKAWLIYVSYAFIDKVQLFEIPRTCREGEFLIVPVNNLPSNVVTRLRWLIPLIEGHRLEHQEQFLITYLADEE